MVHRHSLLGLVKIFTYICLLKLFNRLASRNYNHYLKMEKIRLNHWEEMEDTPT